ncbi:hypothetical protein Tco_1080177 [Tanacetum coccineum]|uniref:Uncharacterized protein n=1 Tax=Tanacetum coccineum TaxID=301880 RepID=A0ABQ5HVM7_9ASTR
MADSAWIDQCKRKKLHQFDRFRQRNTVIRIKSRLVAKGLCSKGLELIVIRKSVVIQKQDATSMYFSEAEYVALSAYFAQVLWLRTQLTDYGFHFEKIPMYYDSKAANQFRANQSRISHTKDNQMSDILHKGNMLKRNNIQSVTLLVLTGIFGFPSCVNLTARWRYCKWESVSPIASASAAEGHIPPKTAEQKLARKNELKAKSTLMLAIPNEHLLKLHA